MNKVQNTGKSIRSFFDGVMGEVHKTDWPNRHELVESTMVVIVSLFMLALLVGIFDKVLATFLRLLIPSS